jgi:poly-gamma-glutamate capsule biosynthesis protein CapA/YwtB (metallophosphatase superfamily)
MKFRIKFHFVISLTVIILIILGPMQLSVNGLTLYPTGTTEVDTIENFDDGEVQLQSFADQDIEPNKWTLDNNITYNNSPYSLKLFGNTWKLETIAPIMLDHTDVWQVSVYVEEIGEIQGFGITDSIQTLLYSFAGTEEVNPDDWITVYQGAFPNNNWNIYQLPVADDWMAKFGYLPVVKGIVFINDRDYSNNGIAYFDEVIDITDNLPIAPEVQILYSVGKIYRSVDGLRSVDVKFTSKVYDPDSEVHIYYWDFGDDSTSNETNPFHTFLVEDDHDYTVLLKVTDETGKWGSASCQISVDPGPTSFPITMNFVGDIILARRIENLINVYGFGHIFDQTISLLGEAADITVVNLESPLTNMGTPHPTKSIVFKGAPENVEALIYAGIDVATLANNHIIDYGLEGLQQTQSVLDSSSISHFGAGADSYEALQPAFYSKSGVNFAFLGSSDRTGQYHNWQPYLNAGYNKPGFADLTKSNISTQINSVKNIADLIIFEMHSGSEYSLYPTDLYNKINNFENSDEGYSPDFRSPLEGDRELRRFAIDEGADVIICHHPHILQGFEVYNGKLIAHSLGNFLFDLDYPETYPTVILDAEINDKGFFKYSIIPIYIDDYIPLRAQGELGLYLLYDLAKRSKDLNTYLKIDKDNVVAEIVLDTTKLQPASVSSVAELTLSEKNGSWISQPLLLNKNGSISSINSITPGSNWQYRLGKQLIWFENFEDEGCTLWQIDQPDEWYDSATSFTGKRSLCQKQESGNAPLYTNLENRVKLYSDSSKYTLHAYLKTENSSNADVEIQFFYDRYQVNPIITENLAAEINGTTDWSFYNNEFSLPYSANFFNLRLASESPQSGESLTWFDNVGLIEWTDWQDYISISNISNPNDYYWMQIKADEELLYASVNYTEVMYSGITSYIDDEEIIVPEEFVLYQNFPNPFNPVTNIQYDLPVYTNVQLKIYDILGREVRMIINESQPPGKNVLHWDGKDNNGRTVSSGVYFYRLQTSEFSKTKKLMLLK